MILFLPIYFKNLMVSYRQWHGAVSEEGQIGVRQGGGHSTGCQAVAWPELLGLTEHWDANLSCRVWVGALLCGAGLGSVVCVGAFQLRIFYDSMNHKPALAGLYYKLNVFTYFYHILNMQGRICN